MTITIRQKLYGLGLLGLAFSIAIGATGWAGIKRVGNSVENVGDTSSAILNHMDASRFLDLTRSDISKVLTATGDAQDTAASQLAEHKNLLRDRLSVAVSKTHDATASDALQKESQLTDQYIVQAGICVT